jgi:hypothetical protein
MGFCAILCHSGTKSSPGSVLRPPLTQSALKHPLRKGLGPFTFFSQMGTQQEVPNQTSNAAALKLNFSDPEL